MWRWCFYKTFTISNGDLLCVWLCSSFGYLFWWSRVMCQGSMLPPVVNVGRNLVWAKIRLDFYYLKNIYTWPSVDEQLIIRHRSPAGACIQGVVKQLQVVTDHLQVDDPAVVPCSGARVQVVSRRCSVHAHCPPTDSTYTPLLIKHRQTWR